MTIQKIFFSYSRADGSAFALKLAVDLKKKGFDVWIDQEDIRAGSEWDIEIEKALQTCDCLLFIETEKSVSSNNVLDEVYYALEQRKKVIPVISIDSKTPFRLQRLQHIDFTKDYDAGLAHLVRELEPGTSADSYQPEQVEPLVNESKSFYQKNSKLILGIAAMVIIIAAAIFYTTKNKTDLSAKVGSAADTSGNQKQGTNTIDANTDFIGNWALVDVEPKVRLKDGYLKIEALDDKKVSIKSYVQFYYFKTNETSFLEVFNAFAGCQSCVLEKDMKLVAEDVAVGSRFIEVAKDNKTGKGKVGDTIVNASANKSIRATVTLQFIDKETAIIKVQQSRPVTLSHELILEPFVYSFRFKKGE